MIDVLRGESEQDEVKRQKRIWEMVLKFRESGLIDLSGLKDTKQNWLLELQKHQLFVEQDQAILQDDALPTLRDEEMRSIEKLRAAFPAEEDIAWHQLYF